MKGAGNGAAEYHGYGRAEIEQPKNPAPRLGREPVCHVENGAREEPGLRRAKKESDNRKGSIASGNSIMFATMPHVIMIRAIHFRAPNLCRARLLGNSNSA